MFVRFFWLFLVLFFCFSFLFTGNVSAITVVPDKLDFGKITVEYGRDFKKKVRFFVTDCPQPPQEDTQDTDNQDSDQDSENDEDTTAEEETTPANPAQCTVWSDQPWIQTETIGFQCGRTADATINLDRSYKPGKYEGKIYFNCAIEGQQPEEQTVEVKLELERIDPSVDDRLVVTPEKVSFDFLRSYLVPQEFSIRVWNANPEHPDFRWAAESDAHWVKLSYTKGTGDSVVKITIDPSLLPVGSHSARVKFYASFYDPDQDVPEGESPDKDTAELLIDVKISGADRLDVEPKILFWSFVKDSDGNIKGETHPKFLHVIKGRGDVFVTADVPWILVKKGIYVTPGKEEFETTKPEGTGEEAEEEVEEEEESEYGPCGSKTSCSEMSSCDEAKYFYEECGLAYLDSDGDGIPCEELCGSNEGQEETEEGGNLIFNLNRDVKINVQRQMEGEEDFSSPDIGEPEKYYEGQEDYEETYTVYLDVRQLQYFDYGRYEGNIVVHGTRDGFVRRVPVVVQIRREGESVVFPVLPVTFDQIIGDYMSADFTVMYPISFQMPVSYQGVHMSYDTKVFMIVESPNSDFLWAYLPWMKVEDVCACLPHSERGYCLNEIRRIAVLDPPPFKGMIPVKWRYANDYYQWANCAYYSSGPVAEVKFSPQIPMYTGRYVFKIYVGENVTNVGTMRVVELRVKDISGCWHLSDTYQGKTYQHEECLRIESGSGTLSGSWYGQPLVVYPGDMQTYIFGFLLNVRGKVFEYQIQRLDDNFMSGRWRYYDEDGVHEWNNFTGVRW